MLGEFIWQADAAVRGGIAGQRARVQRDTRPGNPLHEGHGGIVITIGIMLCFFLQNAVDADGGLVASLSGRNGRPQNGALVIIDRDPLLLERDDRHDRRTYGAGLSDLIPLRAAVAGRCTCPLHRACGSDQAGNTGDSEDRNTAHRSEGVEHVPNPEYSET